MLQMVMWVVLADDIEIREPIMGNLEMWNLVVGFLSATFVLPIIQQPSWSQRMRAGTTFLWSLIIGGGSTWLADEFTAEQLARSILLTFVAAITTYQGFAKPSGIAGAIEGATSPNPRPPSPTP